MDDFIDGLGFISDQDSFDLAAMQYYEELDRNAGKNPIPAPRPAPAPGAPVPEELPVDLENDLDSLALQLMADTAGDDPPKEAAAPVRKSPKKPPFMRREREPSAPSVGVSPTKEETAPLSRLALEAARLFEALPTEDQLLAYTLLQKLAKAADR